MTARFPTQNDVSKDAVIKIIQNVRKQGSVSRWAPPLQAAPAALSVMAVCLAAASSEDAKVIEISETPMGTDGEVFKMPSRFLDSNLKYCSNLGRLAFSEAQAGMHRLQLRAEGMLGCDGTITHIVHLLDDPESARYDLRDNMEELGASADECKVEAENIREKFSRLLKFIMALEVATNDRSSLTVEQKMKNTDLSNKAKADRDKYQTEQDQLRELMTDQKAGLDTANEDLRTAIEALDIANAATIDESQYVSVAEIAFLAEVTNPVMPEQDPGALARGMRKVFGKGEKTKRAEDVKERRRLGEKSQMTKELMDKRQREIESGKEAALKKVHASQAIVKARQDKFEETQGRYDKNTERYWAASKSLEHSKHHLNQLAREKLDLEKVLKILQESTQALAEIKQHIDALLEFFTETTTIVRSAVTTPLKKFLGTIENASVAAGNARGAATMDSFTVREVNKQYLLNAALQLEGNFSLACDIAGVYVAVSKRYIKPGLNKMERLSLVDKTQYATSKEDFLDWCDKAKEEIDGLTIAKQKEMYKRMSENVQIVAIEAKMIAVGPYFETNGGEEDDDDEEE